MKVRNGALLFGSLIFFLLIGCATTRHIAYLDSRIEDQNREVRGLNQKVGNLSQKVGDLHEKTEGLSKRFSSEIQKDWADRETTVEDLQREIKILRANIEEDRELLKRLANDMEGLKKDYEAKTFAYQKEKEEGVAAPPVPPTVQEERPAPVAEDMEGAYQRSYHTFKKGDYPQALRMFREFVRKYPQSEYVDNAQYWIGECYYVQGDYEKAILEYENVIKRYPQGDKVPSALLKQGFAFLNLGDRVDAKLLFKKVIKEYPRSPQAEIAAKKLKGLD